MKKFLFIFAAMFVAISANVFASSNVEVEAVSGTAVASSSSTDYSGTATTSIMFGTPVVYSAPAVYTVDDNDYLSGSFTVGGGVHSVYLESLNPVSSSFTDVPVIGNAAGLDFTGTISGTIAGGILTFTCICTVDGTDATKTVFTFVGQ